MPATNGSGLSQTERQLAVAAALPPYELRKTSAGQIPAFPSERRIQRVRYDLAISRTVRVLRWAGATFMLGTSFSVRESFVRHPVAQWFACPTLRQLSASLLLFQRDSSDQRERV